MTPEIEHIQTPMTISAAEAEIRHILEQIKTGGNVDGEPEAIAGILQKMHDELLPPEEAVAQARAILDSRVEI